MPAPRLARNGTLGRLVGQKVGGGDGNSGKNHAPPQDEEQLQVMKQKTETLQADLSRRQESYIRRERAFNMRIEELEEELARLKVRGRYSVQRNDTRGRSAFSGLAARLRRPWPAIVDGL